MPHRRPVMPSLLVSATPPADEPADSWSAQETEFRRLSHALHDDIATILSVARLRFSGLSRQLSPDSDEAQTARHVSVLLEEAIQNVRRLTQQLLPATLESFGLAAALDDYVRCVSSDSNEAPAIHFRAEGSEHRLPPALELILFRVAQELIRNAQQHAEAQHIEVYLLRQSNRVLLTVSDDGVGFRASNRPLSTGLKNIESRLNLAGGRLIFDLTPGQGVCMLADVPLPSRS